MQINNPGKNELNAAEFQRRLEPQFALANVISTFTSLPVLRGFWPMSGQRDAGIEYATTLVSNFDVGETLTLYWGYENLIPWVYFPNTNTANLTYADDAQFDILGTANDGSYPTQRGITLGLWVKPITLGGGAFQMTLNKWDEPSNISYGLYFSATDKPTFVISDTGAFASRDFAVAPAITASEWYFLVGRWNSSNTSVWLDNVKANNASTKASIFNSNASFNIGLTSGGQYDFDGYVSMAFICACSLSDSIINNLWQISRPLFGK